MTKTTDPNTAVTEGWQPYASAPRDGTPIIIAVRGMHPERPMVDKDHFATAARWVWSPDARLPHEDYPDDGGFLELNNDWGDGWGGNIGGGPWMPFPSLTLKSSAPQQTGLTDDEERAMRLEIEVAIYRDLFRQLDGGVGSEAAQKCYSVHHNPNCPKPFLVRLPRGALDLKAYTETNDALGFGLTFAEAFNEARIALDTPTSDKGEAI